MGCVCICNSAKFVFFVDGLYYIGKHIVYYIGRVHLHIHIGWWLSLSRPRPPCCSFVQCSIPTATCCCGITAPAAAAAAAAAASCLPARPQPSSGGLVKDATHRAQSRPPTDWGGGANNRINTLTMNFLIFLEQGEGPLPIFYILKNSGAGCPKHGNSWFQLYFSLYLVSLKICTLYVHCVTVPRILWRPVSKIMRTDFLSHVGEFFSRFSVSSSSILPLTPLRLISFY